MSFGQVGFQVRGGIGFGYSKRVMYSAMVSNGFALAGHDEGGGGHKTTDPLKYDSGPATIDVSGYPTESQDGYKIFAQRCTKCHSLARPINADYALPDEWSRYVKRMMRKPGSGISKKDGKAIYEFLVYDSSVRKADLIEAKKKAGGNE